MMPRRKGGAAISIALLLPNLLGCATIINGTSQDVALGSTPAGATVTIDGTQATTPAKVTLKRGQDYNAAFTVEGFQERDVKLEKKASGWLFGNILFGGLIGLIIDLVSGGGYKLVPGSIDVDMATGAVKEIQEKKVDEKKMEERK